MARLSRLFVPGYPQLVLQRGHNSCAIFQTEADLDTYRNALRESARELSVAIHAYVLMPDHVHLLLTAPDASSTARLMQRLGRVYVRYFNAAHQRSGTLWEGRYRSTSVEPKAFALACYRYVDLNPVRSGLATDAGVYTWSSCRHHLGLNSDPLVSDHPSYWALGNTPFERQLRYKQLLELGTSAAELESIRFAGVRGWLLGEPPLALGESTALRRTKPLPRGRPRRAEA